MTLRAAQERYDNMQPDEMPEGHCYTGEIVVEDDSGEPTLFEFFMGQIRAVSIDEDGNMIPYEQWNGCDKLVTKADEEASMIWSAS
jgi:hypothetical protein